MIKIMQNLNHMNNKGAKYMMKILYKKSRKKRKSRNIK